MSLGMYSDAFIRGEILPRTEIGGGEGYDPDDRPRRSEADVVVESGRELEAALDGRTSGLVWVPGHANVDMGGRTFTLRGDTVLASDRGVAGSPGAKLYTRESGPNSHAWDGGAGRGVMQMRDNSKLYGLRYIGPQIDVFDNPRMPGYIPFPEHDTYAERKSNVYDPNRARGIKIHDAVEIGNVEIAGWAQQGMYLGSRGNHVGEPHIHHVDGHDCMMESAGYVIDVARGHPLIEDSYFNAARHVVCGFGYGDGGYTVENSLFGPTHSGHILDMHGVHNNMSGDSDPGSIEWKHRAGDRIDVRRCTFTETHKPPASEGINRWPGSTNPLVKIRGVPRDGVTVSRCHIPHESPEDAFNQTDLPSSIDDENGYFRFDWSDNKYGMGVHHPGHGCEPNLEDPLDGEPLIDEETRLSYGTGIGTISGLSNQ